MNEISCDICMDLLPLVTDDVASEDSKQAVLSHLAACPRCKQQFQQPPAPAMDEARINGRIRKRLMGVALALVVVGAALGIAIADGSLLFYNILIMPTVGAVSYVALRKKSGYALALIFASVYLRWLPDSFGYVREGQLAQALIPPLWWAVIYAGLFALGICIAALLCFGLRKERPHEESR